ncbi:TPA: hypothetical protein ACF920_001335 [Escherichia coli]
MESARCRTIETLFFTVRRYRLERHNRITGILHQDDCSPVPCDAIRCCKVGQAFTPQVRAFRPLGVLAQNIPQFTQDIVSNDAPRCPCPGLRS